MRVRVRIRVRVGVRVRVGSRLQRLAGFAGRGTRCGGSPATRNERGRDPGTRHPPATEGLTGFIWDSQDSYRIHRIHRVHKRGRFTGQPPSSCGRGIHRIQRIHIGGGFIGFIGGPAEQLVLIRTPSFLISAQVVLG